MFGKRRRKCRQSGVFVWRWWGGGGEGKKQVKGSSQESNLSCCEFATIWRERENSSFEGDSVWNVCVCSCETNSENRCLTCNCQEDIFLGIHWTACGAALCNNSYLYYYSIITVLLQCYYSYGITIFRQWQLCQRSPTILNPSDLVALYGSRIAWLPPLVSN